jgi:hypothetical protein
VLSHKVQQELVEKVAAEKADEDAHRQDEEIYARYQG